MTPNQSHVAGLELALSKVDPWSAQAVWLRDLAAQAKFAPAEAAQGEAVAIVCGSQVQWLPGAGKIPDRSPLYTTPPSPDAELVALLCDARRYRGVMLMSNPPQLAWDFYRMDERIDAMLASPISCDARDKDLP
jgi:hypothetical protein